jgi:hypothetical protein
MIVDLIPLIVLICLGAQSRAASFHGLNSSPPYYVQAHMIIIVVAMTVLCLTIVAVPAFTGDFTKSEAHASVIPIVRQIFVVKEALAVAVMYWAIFVVIIGTIVMKPEDVVLSSKTNGVSWHGKGDPPRIPPIALIMYALCIMVFLIGALHKILHLMIARKRFRDGGSRTSAEWLRRNKQWPVIRWHRATVLGRQTALGSVTLAMIFIPLSRVVQEGPNGDPPRLVKEGKVSEELLSWMKMLFFVASLILAVKTFLNFCHGFLQTPSLGEAFNDEQDTENNNYGGLERPVSRDFLPDRDPDTQEEPNPLASFFNRLALALATCEAIVIAILAITLFSIVHEHMAMFSTGGWMNGSIYLFALYVFTHTLWGFSVLLGIRPGFRESHGVRHRKFDGFLDVVSACPLILLLYMSCRQRALEVAGRHGVVPEWIQHLIFSCGLLLMIEFLTVVLAPPGKNAKQEEDLRLLSDGGPQAQRLKAQVAQEHAFNRKWRVSYLIMRTLVRFVLYSCLGAIIFGLFWMTEEQCLPKTPAQGPVKHSVVAIGMQQQWAARELAFVEWVVHHI